MLDDAMFEIVEYLNVNDSVNVMKTNKKWKSFISFKYLLQRDYPLAYEICFIEHLNFTDYYQQMKKQICLDFCYAALQYEDLIRHSNEKPNMNICQQALVFLRICASANLEYFVALANFCAYMHGRGESKEFEDKSIQYSDVIFKIANKDPQKCSFLKGFSDFLGRIYAENNQSSKAIWCFEKGLELKEFKCFETVVCHYSNLFSKTDFDLYCSKAIKLFPLNKDYILYGRSFHSECKVNEKIQLLTEAFEGSVHNVQKFEILQKLCHCLNIDKQFKLDVYYRKLQIEIAGVTKIMGCYASLVKTLITDLKNFKEARNLLQIFFAKYGHFISLEVKHVCRRFILELLLSQNAIGDLVEQLSEFDFDFNLVDFHCVINYLNSNYDHWKTNFIIIPTEKLQDENDQIKLEILFKNGHDRHIRYLLRCKLKLNISIQTEIEYLKLNPTKTNLLELALQEKNNEYLQQSLAMKTRPDFDYQDTLELIYSSSCLVPSSSSA